MNTLTTSTMRTLVLVLACLAAMLTVGGATPTVEAAPWKPGFFPSFSSTGTVVELVAPDDSPNAGMTCIAFCADSDGNLYYFAGLDAYAPGTRLFVRANSCTICSLILTCVQPVSPLVNAFVIEL